MTKTSYATSAEPLVCEQFTVSPYTKLLAPVLVFWLWFDSRAILRSPRTQQLQRKEACKHFQSQHSLML